MDLNPGVPFLGDEPPLGLGLPWSSQKVEPNICFKQKVQIDICIYIYIHKCIFIFERVFIELYVSVQNTRRCCVFEGVRQRA